MKLYPGDIVAQKGKGIVGWLSKNLFIPQTDRQHFFLVYGDLLDDYMILESITSKGSTFGQLSWYNLEELEIYRLNDPEWRALGKEAIRFAVRQGRASFDYLLPFQLLASAVRLLLKGRLPPWRAGEFPYARNSHLICTELVNDSYRQAGRPIVPEGVCPLPSEFQRAIQDRKLIRIF